MMGNNLSIAAAVGGGLFVAYCIYFDHKRRNDPLFKQKLKARREEARLRAKAKSATVYPDMSDFDAVQKFFIQEVQIGEECIGQGNEDDGVEHLANAIAVCGQPQSLLQVFASTLPEDVFKRILEILPGISQKVRLLTMSRMTGLSSMSVPASGSSFAGGDTDEDVLSSLLAGVDSSGGIPPGNFGVTIPSSASKTSAAFIDDDVE